MRVLKQRYYACVTTLYVILHKELSPISERNGVKEKTQDWIVLKATYLSLRNFLVDGISLLSSVSSNELHTIQLLGRISTHGLDFCRGTCWGVHFPQTIWRLGFLVSTAAFYLLFTSVIGWISFSLSSKSSWGSSAFEAKTVLEVFFNLSTGQV